MSSKTVVGVDIGRSAVKITVSQKGLFSVLSYPSTVIPFLELSDPNTERTAKNDIVDLGERGKFYVGETAVTQGKPGTQGGLSDDWVLGLDYFVLLSSVMNKLEAAQISGLGNAIFVLGLPGHMVKHFREGVAKIGKSCLPVDSEIHVISQPQGAYLSYMLKPNGHVDRSRAMGSTGQGLKYLVLDVGHFTSDYLMVDANGRIPEHAIGVEAGLYTAIEHLVSLLSKEGIVIKNSQAEEAIRSKIVVRRGKEIDVSAAVEIALLAFTESLIKKGGSVWTDQIEGVKSVLLAGGATSLIADAMFKKWDHVLPLENPRMAVSNGYCKFGISIAVQRDLGASPQAVDA